MTKVSVIICTHNPRPDIFSEVLGALRGQTVPTTEWELLLIDNLSEPPVPSDAVEWHPHARLIQEKQLGSAQARIRGISEAIGEMLLFTDDDAILAADYIERAVHISKTHPQIGVFGGNIELRTEIPVPIYFEPHLDILAKRKVTEAAWGRLYLDAIVPCGAGMVFKQEVAHAYMNRISNIGRRLGRRGKDDLTSGEDNDLAFTACDLGLGIGLFPELQLTHVIPKERLTKEYMLKLMEGISFSTCILAALRPGRPSVSSAQHRIAKLIEYVMTGRFSWSVAKAKLRGQRRATEYLREAGK